MWIIFVVDSGTRRYHGTPLGSDWPYRPKARKKKTRKLWNMGEDIDLRLFQEKTWMSEMDFPHKFGSDIFSCARCSGFFQVQLDKRFTIVDVVSSFRNENDSFSKRCPGMVNFCLISCRPKTSTPQTSKRAERARWRAQEYSRYKKETSQLVMSKNPINLWKKCHLLLPKNKNHSMIRPKQGKREMKQLDHIIFVEWLTQLENV